MGSSRSQRRALQVALLVLLTLLSLVIVPAALARPFAQLIVFGDSLGAGASGEARSSAGRTTNG